MLLLGLVDSTNKEVERKSKARRVIRRKRRDDRWQAQTISKYCSTHWDHIIAHTMCVIIVISDLKISPYLPILVFRAKFTRWRDAFVTGLRTNLMKSTSMTRSGASNHENSKKSSLPILKSRHHWECSFTGSWPNAWADCVRRMTWSKFIIIFINYILQMVTSLKRWRP